MAQDKDDPGTIDMFNSFKFENGGNIKDGKVEMYEPELIADEVEGIQKINRDTPKVVVRNNGMLYDLVVNGAPLMEGYSYGYLEAVKFALEHPDIWYPTEAYEVADSIRTYLRRF